jgi:hypothetical protein
MALLGIILIFIIWTWGLTPTWVNVVVTILASLMILDDAGDDNSHRLL